MTSVLDRKLIRDLRSSGGMILAIASIIAVGVACFVALRSAYHNLDEARRRYYARCRMADFSIELKKAPVVALDALGRLPGITEIRPRLQFYVTVDLDGVEEPLSGLVLSLPERRDAPMINDVVLRRGSYFTDRRDEEVIVNDAFARKHGLHPGDRIHLLLNNRRQALHVVGTAISSEFVYLLGPGALVPDPEHFGVFYLKHGYLEEAFDFKGACNQVLGLLAPDVRDRPDPLLERAERLMESSGVVATTPRRDQLSNRYVSNELNELSLFAVIMPAIFLTVAALVLGVLMGRLIEHQRTEIGTLKALGYPDGLLLAHILKFGLVVGLVGGVVGLGLGYLLAGAMTRMYEQFFEFPALVNRVDPAALAVGLLTGLACTLLGSVHGARAVLRLDPAEAMRPRSPRQGGTIALEHLGWLWGRLGTGWRLVLRNVARTRRRSFVGVLSAAAATSLLVTGFLFSRAAFHMMELQFRKLQRSDIDLTVRDGRGREALLDVLRLPGVDHAEPMLAVACTFRNGPRHKKGGITGLTHAAFLTVPRDRDGRPVPLPSSGLLLERHLAETLRVGPGDVLTVEPIRGRREPRRARVVALLDSYLGLAAYADIRYLSRLVDEEYAVTGAQLSVDPRPSSRGALHAELRRLPALEGVSDREEQYTSLMATFVGAVRGSTGFLILAAGVILFGTTLNASLIGLAERQREVATLLVLGYTPRAVGGLFLREGLVINLAGTLLGLPGGYLIYRGVGRIEDAELFRLPIVNPASAWAWALSLSVLFVLASHAVVQVSINRMDWLEKLKTRE
ncbi:MAG: ABC transporter permease [Planctomycetaceae bacterium]|nr:ABC transporter permease [Planctomycetaceae bacterium]